MITDYAGCSAFALAHDTELGWLTGTPREILDLTTPEKQEAEKEEDEES